MTPLLVCPILTVMDTVINPSNPNVDAVGLQRWQH